MDRRRWKAVSCSIAACVLLALPAQSVVRRESGHEARLVVAPAARVRAVVIDPSEKTAAGAAARRFESRFGGRWDYHVDRRTGRPVLVQGSGMHFAAGLIKTGAAELVTLEPAAREVIAVVPEWLLPDRGRLSLDHRRSAIRGDGKLISLYFEWLVDGVPVEGATVFLRVNSGRLTQLGAPLVGRLSGDAVPAIGAESAVARLLEHGGDAARHELVGAPQLWFQPEERGGTLQYRLVWKVRYRVPGQIETWEGRIDARSGAVVGFRDVNHYGRVVGGVYPRTVFDQDETTVPLSLVDVDVEGVATTSDIAGAFGYVGGATSAVLDGQWFRTTCVGCSNPAQAAVGAAVGAGYLDFGTGGANELGNGASTPAERNSYYHLNQVRRVAQPWLAGLAWFNVTLASNVNIEATCNAFYNGNVNFFRGGGSCNNTGEIADVVYHEWGHGLDLNTAAGDGATGEGTADAVSMHMTHSPLIGPGFLIDGTPVRNIDPDGPRGPLTVANIGNSCPPSSDPGPLGYQVHCEGEIYGQTSWELAQALVARHGHHTGWRVSERLFFSSLPDAGGYLPSSTLPIYSAYLFADDDDGDLANGTPHAAEIFAAFDAHGIAGAALPASPHCLRPAQPALTVSPGCDRVDLSWEAVPGAASYDVLRGELRADQALFPLASLTAPASSYTDLAVAPGVDYWYVVMAVDAGGCESTIELPVATTLPPQPALSVVAAVVDDAPRGNRSGFADPDEEVDLTLTLANLGGPTAATVQATLAAAAPVTFIDGTADWPALLPGDSAANSDVLRFRADSPANGCGDVIRFSLTPTDGGVCLLQPSYLDVELGDAGVCDPPPASFMSPTFDGLESALPGSSCAEVALSWSAGTSHCINAQLTYRVYRSTDPNFLPQPATLLASGVTTTAYIDKTATPDETFHYIVRAHDSRSGEDGNVLRLTSVAPGFPDSRSPLFAGVETVEPGPDCGSIALSWTAASDSCSAPISYEIYRDVVPFFTPSPANRVGSSLSMTFVDAGLVPGMTYSYIVRARDASGNETSHQVPQSTTAGVTDRIYFRFTFENEPEGWATAWPNDATSGNWEWGNPSGTEIQPEDCAEGNNCWITGLAPNAEVDGGTTTLVSDRRWVFGLVEPTVEYSRWFTTNQGPNVDEMLVVDVTDDDGLTWVPLERVDRRAPLEWVRVRIPLPDSIEQDQSLLFRFVASDTGGPSTVEAGLDDFAVIDPGQGCSQCWPPARRVPTILVSRVGDDILIDWSADPRPGERFAVYSVSGPGLADVLRVGTTKERFFYHENAVLVAQDLYHRVSSFDECGRESPLD